MPVPMWVAQVNKRFFNRLVLRRGKSPVVTHMPGSRTNPPPYAPTASGFTPAIMRPIASRVVEVASTTPMMDPS